MVSALDLSAIVYIPIWVWYHFYYKSLRWRWGWMLLTRIPYGCTLHVYVPKAILGNASFVAK